MRPCQRDPRACWRELVGSVSNPRTAAKCTSRESRSSLATTTGHVFPLRLASARASASLGRRSRASEPLPVCMQWFKSCSERANSWRAQAERLALMAAGACCDAGGGCADARRRSWFGRSRSEPSFEIYLTDIEPPARSILTPKIPEKRAKRAWRSDAQVGALDLWAPGGRARAGVDLRRAGVRSA